MLNRRLTTEVLSERAVMELLSQVEFGPDQEIAAKTLYLSFYSVVWSYLRAKCADIHGVEEITQDVFLSVFTKPSAFQGRSRFSTWLLGIANFKLIDWQRSQLRHATHCADVEDDVVAGIEDPDWDFVSRLETSQMMTLLRTCIGLLPNRYREVITSVSLYELSEVEAAQLLQCPQGTVKSRLSAARRKLQACVTAGAVEVV